MFFVTQNDFFWRHRSTATTRPYYCSLLAGPSPPGIPSISSSTGVRTWTFTAIPQALRSRSGIWGRVKTAWSKLSGDLGADKLAHGRPGAWYSVIFVVWDLAGWGGLRPRLNSSRCPARAGFARVGPVIRHRLKKPGTVPWTAPLAWDKETRDNSLATKIVNRGVGSGARGRLAPLPQSAL